MWRATPDRPRWQHLQASPLGDDLSVEEEELVIKQTHHPILNWQILSQSDSQQLCWSTEHAELKEF